MNRFNKIKIIDAEIGYVTKKSKTILLSNINLSAEKGENIALIGINGSGKSTLLRSLSGIQQLLAGSITIDNKKNEQYTPTELAKKLAIVNSEIINTKYLKVFDLVRLGRFPHQAFSKKQSINDLNIINNALSVTGILHLSDKNINEISDGERQKVMIARALSQDTDIILLDEPTAFLDIENKYSVYNILSKTASEQNKTIIFSTHDLNIALKHADKVWLIKDNTIFEGAPEDLILQDTFTNLFKNKDVYFNKLTNEFSIQHQNKYPVKLINNTDSELLKQVTINALNRKQFYVDNKTSKLIVDIEKDNQWIIRTTNKTENVNSIYNLIKNLLKLRK